tara:strand:- start:1099 stop:1212 length:114 start_codon:yes stop_codon:yes gene_type:complete
LKKSKGAFKRIHLSGAIKALFLFEGVFQFPRKKVFIE